MSRHDPERTTPPAGGGGQRISGKQARQGHIVLRTRGRRAIFFAGLVAAAVLAIAVAIVT